MPEVLLIVGAVMLLVIGFLWVGERVQKWRAAFDELDPPDPIIEAVERRYWRMRHPDRHWPGHDNPRGH